MPVVKVKTAFAKKTLNGIVNPADKGKKKISFLLSLRFLMHRYIKNPWVLTSEYNKQFDAHLCSQRTD